MDNYLDRYQNLNDEQKEAVDYIDGPLLVIAGPGTGKTEILSLRVANILRQGEVEPRNILCITFTNSASFNMRERLSQLIGRDAYKVDIHTFHSFGVHIISSYPNYFYNSTTFYPIDDLTQIEILEEIIGDLEYDSDLKKQHDGKYTYLDSVKSMISNLKKAGYNPDDFREILVKNKQSCESLNPEINSIFSSRISNKIFDPVEKFLEIKNSEDISKEILPNIQSIESIIIDSLSTAFSDAEKDDSTKPITAWKHDFTKKDDSGLTVLKDSLYIDKLLILADLYERYQGLMHKKKYFDYDDMILDAIKGIIKNKALKYDLQNRYQYILVDEFQDTNGAQMKLLDLIASTDDDENVPNIMAVGDDDQAIYKFHGAELSNILHFKDLYKQAEIIPITKNYRSVPAILDVSSHIIKQAKVRLVDQVSDLDKEITSEIKDPESCETKSKSFPTDLHEYYWIGNKIKQLIKDGHSPREIAVISRVHKDLEEFALILNNLKIPISYERSNNVLKEPHIYQLIQISRFICSLCRKNIDEADELLPEILSYPFWDIDRNVIWDISVNAERSGRKRLRWLDIMKNHDDKKIKELYDFFIDLASTSLHETLEHVLDEIMGAQDDLTPDDENEEDNINTNKDSKQFISPFKQYYFERDKISDNSVKYIRFLSGLRTFIQALRDYKKDQTLSIEHLVEFVDLHESNNIRIVDRSPYINSYDAVNLLSAHKAKGLEFETVFVLNCQEDVWRGKGRGSSLPPPVNLPITPAGDTEDDQLRLFYVTITRAKYNLYMLSYEQKSTGNESSLLSFLVTAETNDSSNISSALTIEKNSDELKDSEKSAEILGSVWQSIHNPPLIHDENAVIKKLLENYRLSVTHLNNFLDVANGGPQNYFEHNILRFPQSQSLSGSFGTAVHSTMEFIYGYLKNNNKLPGKDLVLDKFDEELSFERLNKKDFKDYSKKGRKAIGLFYDKKIDNFDKSHISELNFRDHGVVIGDAHLTGKIDKIVPIKKDEFSVHDFKTGKPKREWGKGELYDKMLLHKYRRQLVFYKILIENSKNFEDKYKVNTGVLEFVEPDKNEIIDLVATIEEDEVERTLKLIDIVYSKIMDLDFPDTSEYKQDLNGMIKFEDDLLEGKI